MRKYLAAGLLALPLGLGCQHVGGVCDCAPIPGDSTGYNPHVTYHATCPGGETVKPAGGTASTAISTDGWSFEPIGPPRMSKPKY